jgi:predicted nucleotidyltransferase
MQSLSDIRMMAQEMADAVHPLRVILFGSHARGQAREDSDVDFLVVADDSRPRPKRSAALYSLLRDYPCSKDIVVYTPQEIEKYRRFPASLVSRALGEGVTLYER